MNMFAKNEANSVEEYLLLVPEERQKEIDFLHDFIQKAVPKLKAHYASNMIGYGSFYYLDSKKQKKEWPIISLANQKNYISIYVCTIIEDKAAIEKYKKDAKDKGRDSWWLAYCMDVGEEEKAKGKTVEVGRATFNTPSKQFTVFDAPGHKNYVPNMIMGAALADFAGLVISARKGEFEAGFEKDGQTREHVQLAKSLGV